MRPGVKIFIGLATTCLFFTGVAIFIAFKLVQVDNLPKALVNEDVTAMFSLLVRLQYSMLAVYALIAVVCFVLLWKYSGLLLDAALKGKLTGAYSGHSGEPLLRREVKNAVKYDGTLALLMLAPDHFRTVKDIFGDSFGDTVMMSVSKTVKRYLQPSDHFYRFGDEILLAAIPNMPIEAVLQVAEGLRGAVEKTGIFNDELKRAIKVTASIGVAHLNSNKLTGQELVANAAMALSAAQRTNNSVLLFRPDNRTKENDALTAEDCNSLVDTDSHLH
jgi:diguanylate cyclase (GGDEF)-like protein